MIKKVYMAGPDIFRPEWPDTAARILNASAAWGFEPLLPIPAGQSLDRPGVTGITSPGTAEDAQPVFASCLAMVRSCDAVVADITPFRGDEPDSGTVFEIATAYSLRKPVIAYTRDTRLTHERHAHNGSSTENGALLCRSGLLVERFGLPCNVMVAQACLEIVFGDVVDALSALKRWVTLAAPVPWRSWLSIQDEDKPC